MDREGHSQWRAGNSMEYSNQYQATCLLTEVISEKAAVRPQLALFVDVTRARNCPIRCWSCGASLPYQWSLRLESESVKLLSAPLDSCVLGLATQSIASVKWLMFDWAWSRSSCFLGWWKIGLSARSSRSCKERGLSETFFRLPFA